MPQYTATPLLADAARVKRLLAAHGAFSDELIADQLAAASNMARNWCNRQFSSATYTDEAYDGDGENELMLNEFPVTALTSVRALDESADEVALVVADDVIMTARDAQMGRIRINPRSTTALFRRFPQGEANVLVTYTAGFAEIPDAVQEGVALWAADLCLQLKRDPSVASETLGKHSYTNRTASGSSFSGRAEPPDNVKLALGYYRNPL
jgi:hypothetical protein